MRHFQEFGYNIAFFMTWYGTFGGAIVTIHHSCFLMFSSVIRVQSNNYQTNKSLLSSSYVVRALCHHCTCLFILIYNGIVHNLSSIFYRINCFIIIKGIIIIRLFTRGLCVISLHVETREV